MPWKPLSDDVPLDHEALQPPQQPMGTGEASNFTALPDDAQLDQPAAPKEPPAIAATVRSHPLKSEEVNPTTTEAGFNSDLHPDPVYHTALSDADKKEYAGFFKDPKKPPTAATLGLWYHQKTGAYLANAQDIVDAFKQTGKFRTQEKITIPKPNTTVRQAAGHHWVNGALAEYAPEAGAVFDTLGIGGSGQDRPNIWNSDSSLGNIWANNADLNKATLDAETEQHPVASIAGELAGVASATPVLGAAGEAIGAAKLGSIARPVVQGMVEGAAYGSGAGGPGHRLEGAATGAAMVPAVAGVSKLPIAAVNAGKSVLEGSPGLARRIIAKAIKDDMNTPESVGQAISEAHANGVPMALGDTGENVRGLLASSSRASGVGRTIVRDALEERQGALADRITQHIERDLGPVANPHQVADDLLTKAQTDAKPLYEAAYARSGAAQFSQKVAALLQRPSMKKALAYAYRTAQEEGRNPEELGLATVKDRTTSILDANGNNITVPEVEMVANPTWQTLDYVKRGADDLVESYKNKVTGRYNFDTEGNAANNTLRTYLKAFDVANPDYAAARNAYAGPVKGIAALNTGRKFLNMTADDIEARMRDMSPFEKTMAAAGTRRAMAELVQSKGDTADIVHALVGTGKKRAMLARLFGDRKQFQRFTETLGQEKEGWRSFKQALLGSPTAANVSDDAALQTATLAADFATTGLPIATSIRHALKFGVGKLGEKSKQQIAALLSNTDPAAIRELAAELRAKAEQRGIRVRRINTVTNAVGKGAVVAMPRQQAQ